MTDELRAACHDAVHVITVDGDILRAGVASMFILEQLGYRTLARLGRLPPLIWGVEAGYWVVAKNRRFFSRFLFKRE